MTTTEQIASRNAYNSLYNEATDELKAAQLDAHRQTSDKHFHAACEKVRYIIGFRAGITEMFKRLTT